MSESALLAYAVAMFVVSIIPGPGIMVVVSQSLSRGLKAGLMASLGIVAGDYVFLGLVFAGLATMAQTFAGVFVVIKYLGAAYLLYLGIKLLRSNHESLFSIPAEQALQQTAKKHTASFMAGFVTTLGNPKAILFYVSIFPSVIDLHKITLLKVVSVTSITTVIVFSVMATYAYIAARSMALLKHRTSAKKLNTGAGLTLCGCGVFMMLR